MAALPDIKEKVHLPLYDAFAVPSGQQSLGQAIGPEQRIYFFVNIQNKTRLETNLQTAGVLPHLNSFEVRAMRVVVSQPKLSRLLPDDCLPILEEALKVTRFRKRDRWNIGAFCRFLEQRLALSSAWIVTAIAELIYHSVTSLIVGEKVMIEMPTFWFPAGAGISAGTDLMANHGKPDPQATFRFAEPITIEARQNFRAELSFPQGIPHQVAALSGPFRLWVVLDGYLTRAVQ